MTLHACRVHMPEMRCGLRAAAGAATQSCPDSPVPWLTLFRGLLQDPTPGPVSLSPRKVAHRPPPPSPLPILAAGSLSLPPPDPAAPGQASGLPPDGHQPHQGPARVVDLGLGTLHIATLLAGLEVFPPASVSAICRDSRKSQAQEILCTGSPAETERRTAITLGLDPCPSSP